MPASPPSTVPTRQARPTPHSRVHVSQAAEVLAQFDADDSGAIDLEEFVHIVHGLPVISAEAARRRRAEEPRPRRGSSCGAPVAPL